jgi:hypothetical protein
MFYQNTEEKNREGRKASVWGVEIFSAYLSVDGRAKEVNKRTMGHIEISSFSAFDERRSVPRDVEKGAYTYKHISAQKDYKGKNVSKFIDVICVQVICEYM